jgi:hypothetical protein
MRLSVAAVADVSDMGCHGTDTNTLNHPKNNEKVTRTTTASEVFL